MILYTFLHTCVIFEFLRNYWKFLNRYLFFFEILHKINFHKTVAIDHFYFILLYKNNVYVWKFLISLLNSANMKFYCPSRILCLNYKWHKFSLMTRELSSNLHILTIRNSKNDAFKRNCIQYVSVYGICELIFWQIRTGATNSLNSAVLIKWSWRKWGLMD